nr:immunoglobulin heavy chain junction region [Mus musculus]
CARLYGYALYYYAMDYW